MGTLSEFGWCNGGLGSSSHSPPGPSRVWVFGELANCPVAHEIAIASWADAEAASILLQPPAALASRETTELPPPVALLLLFPLLPAEPPLALPVMLWLFATAIKLLLSVDVAE